MSLKNLLKRFVRPNPLDLFFYDGTSYRSLLNSLSANCGTLIIRHDIDDESHVPIAKKFARIEKDIGINARYFIFLEHLQKYADCFPYTGVHRRWDDNDGYINYSDHGEPGLYQNPPRTRLQVNILWNWSYLGLLNLFITDSSGVWSSIVDPGDMFEHELWEDPRRKGLTEALIYCFKNNPKTVQLSIHPNPLTWRAA